MAKQVTDNNTTINNAAKDDHIGNDGDFQFTYTELVAKLLANDPGGAAKVNVDTQFYFGADPVNTLPTLLQQQQYLASHGIHYDPATHLYTIGADATNIEYFVQIGNKGTWSNAQVCVTAPEVVIQPHVGGNLFTENFDGIGAEHVWVASGSVWNQVNLDAAHGWTGAAYSEIGANGYLEVETTSGTAASAFWLDTQNSPGPINISHLFDDETDAVAGITSVLSFDIAKQNFDGHVTGANESLEFRIDGVAVATIHASDLANAGEMYHHEVNIASYLGAGDTHTLSLVDTTGDFTFNGFSVDSIRIDDWIV